MSTSESGNVAIHKLDQQLSYVPKEVTWCQRCVLSSQRPRLQIGDDGICSACKYSEFQRTSMDWGKRRQEFEEFLANYRSTDGSYDCLVPSSGGKDSGFVASVLKEDYGMHPLAITATPFQRTEIGQGNFRSFIYAGYPTVEVHFNGKLHRKLARLCMETCGDPWQPFAWAQLAVPHQMGIKLGIPLLAYGEAGEKLYSGETKIRDYLGMPPELWNEQYFKGWDVDRLLLWGLENTDYIKSEDFCDADLDWYRCPSLSALQAAQICMLWTSEFVLWTPQESFYRASRSTGFMPNPQRSVATHQRYASIDDWLDPWHFAFGFAKWGLNRVHHDCAHEIREGHIERIEALALVNRYGDELPTQPYVDFASNYMEVTEAYLWHVFDEWRAPHLWDRRGGEWELLHRVE